MLHPCPRWLDCQKANAAPCRCRGEAVAVPELEGHCGSWIVRKKKGGRIYELFDRRDVEKCAAAGWQVWTAAQWLGEFNRLGRQPD